MTKARTVLWSNLEYIPLRFARRFLAPGWLLRTAGRLIPCWQPSENESDPGPIVDKYEAALGAAGTSAAGRDVVEIGVGATNSTCYEIAARGAATVFGMEPSARFASHRNEALLTRIARRHKAGADALRGKVRRIGSLDAVADGSADLVLSHSVLEHVRDPQSLFNDCSRILKPRGLMVHVVDYRDHFFKYPYHFLQFSRRTWARWLDPGDLPGWRAYDHTRMLETAGFSVQVLDARKLDRDFARVLPHIAAGYDRADPLLGVARCTLVARRTPAPRGAA